MTVGINGETDILHVPRLATRSSDGTFIRDSSFVPDKAQHVRRPLSNSGVLRLRLRQHLGVAIARAAYLHVPRHYMICTPISTVVDSTQPLATCASSLEDNDNESEYVDSSTDNAVPAERNRQSARLQRVRVPSILDILLLASRISPPAPSGCAARASGGEYVHILPVMMFGLAREPPLRYYPRKGGLSRLCFSRSLCALLPQNVSQSIRHISRLSKPSLRASPTQAAYILYSFVQYNYSFGVLSSMIVTIASRDTNPPLLKEARGIKSCTRFEAAKRA
jgi:hypothetical protein